MQEQAKVSPQLTSFQIQSLAALLTRYAGQDVSLHQTTDTVAGRLGATIKMAFNQAGINVHPIAVPNMVEAGQVAIFLGPN